MLQITQEGVVKEYRAEADGDRLVLKGDFEEGKAVMVKYCEENYCNAVLFNSEDNPVYGFTFEI